MRFFFFCDATHVFELTSSFAWNRYSFPSSSLKKQQQVVKWQLAAVSCQLATAAAAAAAALLESRWGQRRVAPELEDVFLLLVVGRHVAGGVLEADGHLAVVGGALAGRLGVLVEA